MYLRRLDSYPNLADGRCQVMNTPDGVRIRTAVWPAMAKPSKGTVCLLQGRAEFIEKYYEVIGELRQRGFAVATFDWRGQGASDRLLKDPLKGHVQHFSDYGTDLNQFLKEIALPDCPPPHFALTHSMGGLVLLTELPRLRAIFERALLSTPLIEIAQKQRRFMGRKFKQSSVRNIAGALRIIGRGGAYMPGSNHTPFDPGGFVTNPLTSSGPRYDRNRQFLIDFPELAIAGPTAAWVHETCKAMDSLHSSDYQSTIHTPSLIVTASLDTVSNPIASEYFASTTRALHAVSIPGSLHEIMMETPFLRAQFWAAFDSFIPGKNSLERDIIDQASTN